MRKQFEKHRTVLYTNTGAGNWAKVTISTSALIQQHTCCELATNPTTVSETILEK